uniref:Malectin domain-containing protein n=1 Tax=Oryza brachyantha TaxID=4533 RepID=J3MK03_ORYBR
MNLGNASYYVTTNGMDIIYSSQHFQNTIDSKLFETARMSASSLRYYDLGLDNGNYTVLLQFAEFSYPDSPTWLSLGMRVFDIYVQVHVEHILNLFRPFSECIIEICIGRTERKEFRHKEDWVENLLLQLIGVTRQLCQNTSLRSISFGMAKALVAYLLKVTMGPRSQH